MEQLQFKKDKINLYQTCKCIMDEISNHPYKSSNAHKALAKGCKKFLEHSLFRQKETEKNPNLIFWCSKITFYGHHLAWNKDEWLKSALIVYNYFKAKTIVDTIKSYEAIYKEEIVHNYNEVLEYFYDSLSKNEIIQYESIPGLTSSFTYIPISKLESKLNKFKELYE